MGNMHTRLSEYFFPLLSGILWKYFPLLDFVLLTKVIVHFSSDITNILNWPKGGPRELRGLDRRLLTWLDFYIGFWITYLKILLIYCLITGFGNFDNFLLILASLLTILNVYTSRLCRVIHPYLL